MPVHDIMPLPIPQTPGADTTQSSPPGESRCYGSSNCSPNAALTSGQPDRYLLGVCILPHHNLVVHSVFPKCPYRESMPVVCVPLRGFNAGYPFNYPNSFSDCPNWYAGPASYCCRFSGLLPRNIPEVSWEEFLAAWLNTVDCLRGTHQDT